MLISGLKGLNVLKEIYHSRSPVKTMWLNKSGLAADERLSHMFVTNENLLLPYFKGAGRKGRFYLSVHHELVQ